MMLQALYVFLDLLSICSCARKFCTHTHQKVHLFPSAWIITTVMWQNAFNSFICMSVCDSTMARGRNRMSFEGILSWWNWFMLKCLIVAELLWIQRSWGIVRYPIVSKVFIFVSIVFGGPGRQQFRQKGEPSEFRQFFNWKLKNLIFIPKWPPWSNYNFWFKKKSLRQSVRIQKK